MPKTLYPRQVVHTDRLWSILSTHGTALDSSDTGTGKTLCASEISKRHGRDVLVVCLKSGIPAWEKELIGHGVRGAGVVNYEKVRTGKTPYGEWTGEKKKKWLWTLPEGTLVIFDEAHKAGGIGTQNSKIMIEAKDRYPVLMLSATVASTPLQMRGVGYLLGAHSLGNFWQWCKKHGCTENPWGGFIFDGSEEHIRSIALDVAHRCSRMTHAELADHFMETQIITDPLDFGPEIGKVFDQMEKELDALKERVKGDSDGAVGLTEQLRARQKVELLKVPYILELADDYMLEGRSVAIFVNFNQTVEALVKRFGEDCAVIRGGQTGKARQENIEAFQNNQVRVVICNAAAGGVGISLHDEHGGHPRASIISPDWNEKVVIQVIGRIHRAGGKTPSLQRILFAANTVEEEVEKSVRKKISLLNLLNEESTCTEGSEVVEYTPSRPSELTLDPLLPLNTSATLEIVTHTNPETRPHAEHSPSSLKNFEACPSYHGRSGTNPIAEAGTRIHGAVEKGDSTLLSDETEQVLADTCLQFIAKTRATKAKSAKMVASHQEIFLNMQLRSESTYGTSDQLDIYDDGTAVLYDWKTGFGKAEDAEENAQVQAYVLGSFQKFPQIKSIRAYLVYPRRREISYADYARDQHLPTILLRLSTIISRAKGLAGKVFNPTEGVCDYCANQGSCQALADKILRVGKMHGFEVPDEVDLTKCTPAQKAQWYKLAKLLSGADGPLEAIKGNLLREVLDEGLELPGYRIDQRRTPRTILHPNLGYDAVKHLVSFEEYLMACTRVSVPDLEKFVSERSPKGKKAAAKLQLEDALRNKGALRDESFIHVLKAIKE